MGIIGGGKIYSFGNGGDGIRIGKGGVYNVAETFTGGNGGHGFVHEGALDITSIISSLPSDMRANFLRTIKDTETLGQDHVVEAAEKTGLKQWLADHGFEAGSFILEFVDKAQAPEWVTSVFHQYIG